MPGNVTSKDASGATFTAGSDRIANVDFFIEKSAWGPDGSLTQTADVDGQRLPVGGAAIGNPTDAAASSDTGTFGLLALLKRLLAKTPSLGSATMANSSPVVIASDQGIIPVSNNGISTNGTITAVNANLATGTASANSAVSLGLNGSTGFALDIRGPYVGTIVVQGTINGNDWTTISVIPVGAGLNVAQVASITTAGAWWGNGNGFSAVRATASAYTSGTATVTLRAMQAAGLVFTFPSGQATQAISGTVTDNIGSGSVAAGTNLVGDVGLQARANATGAASIANVVSAATANPTVVKGSSGRILGGLLVNTNAAIRYMKLHNTSAAPTPGAGVVATIPLPPNQPVNVSEAIVGLGFATGIGYTIVTGAATTDTTAVAANEVTGFLAFA